MKKIFLFLTALCFFAFANKVVGQTWNISDNSSSGNNVTATLTGSGNNRTLTISGTGNMADFDVSLNGIPWNNYLTNIETVVIQSGVTNIGNIAFQGCSNLDLVTIPNSVTIIGVKAFENCSNLQSITIPSGVTKIEGEAFNNCINLRTVTITEGDNVLSISYYSIYTGSKAVFTGCPIQTLYLGRQYEYVVNTILETPPFKGITTLQSLTIGNKIASLRDGEFANCSSLTNVTIEDGLATLYYTNDDVFYNCPVQTLYMGRNVVNGTIITYNPIFYGKTSLSSLTIGNDVTSIENSAFSGCTGLTSSVIIPNSVTSIGNNAFYGCVYMPSVTIGASVETIGDYAFYQCRSLTSINIPNKVTTINSYAFANSDKIKTVTIADGLATLSLGSSSFQGCPVQTLYFGRDISVSSAFSGITSLSSLTIGNNVTSIPNSTFSGCTGLTQITSNPTTPPTISTNTFNSVDKSIPVYINCNYLTAYQTAQYWNDFTNYQCATIVSLNVSPTSYNFPANGGTSSVISITSNQSWTISSNAPWLTTSKTSGSGNSTFTITAAANASTSPRSGTVTVTGGGKTGTISISQDGTNTPQQTDGTVNTSNGGKLTFMAYNLGANPNMTIDEQMAYKTAGSTDATVYGDLYQWGRRTDGHEKRNSNTTLTQSNTDIPGHSNFILAESDPGDWRNPQNDNLWGSIKTANDPCPAGWRVPTNAEWESIINTNTWTYSSTGTPGYKISPDGGKTYTLFLPAASFRSNGNNAIPGYIYDAMPGGYYWSSDVNGSHASELWFSYVSGPYGTSSNLNTSYADRGQGMCVRCVMESGAKTDINSVSTKQLTIYPNPTKSEIFIESELPIQKVEIYSLSGALLLSDNNFNGTISLSSLLKGTYIVKIYTDSGVKIRKIVKE